MSNNISLVQACARIGELDLLNQNLQANIQQLSKQLAEKDELIDDMRKRIGVLEKIQDQATEDKPNVASVVAKS